jgi:hypothetical protein
MPDERELLYAAEGGTRYPQRGFKLSGGPAAVGKSPGGLFDADAVGYWQSDGSSYPDWSPNLDVIKRYILVGELAIHENDSEMLDKALRSLYDLLHVQ